MANYLCDVLRIHKSSRADLIAALRPRQWGMAEDTYNRIIVKTLCGNTREFWPRVNDNIALRGKWVGNSGGSNGIRVTDAGLVGINTATPLNPLHVKSDSTKIAIRVDDKNGSYYGMIGVDHGSNSVDFYHTDVKVLSLALCGSEKEVKLYKDINNDDWQSYTAGSVTGISAALDKRIKYKTVGHMTFVDFYIAGTSNGSSIGFTVPYKSKTSINGYAIHAYVDDGLGLVDGTMSLSNLYGGVVGRVTITVGIGNPFSNGNHVIAQGQFFYEHEVV